MATSAAPWRARIGGRWAVSWQGYLLLAPVAIPLSLLVVPAFFSGDTWAVGLLVATVAYLAVGGVLWIGSITVLRSRFAHPVSPWWVMLVGGMAWLARSTVFALFLSRSGAPADAPLAVRLGVGFGLGVVFVPAVAWLLATIEEFGTERRRLVDQLARKEAAAEQSGTYLDLLRRQLLDPVEVHMRTTASRLATGGSASPADASAELDALDATLRAASHELAPHARAHAQSVGRIPIRAVVDATAHRPFSAWPIPFIAAIAVAYIARFTPAAPTLLAVGTAAVWSLLVALIANRTCQSLDRPSWTRYGLFVLLLLASGLAADAALHLASQPDLATTQMTLILSVPFTVFMVAGGIGRGVNVAEQAVLDDLRTSISTTEVSRRALEVEEDRMRVEIAARLHGSLAANVTAASMRLRHAMEQDDAASAMQAIVEARGLLEVDLATSMLVGDSDLTSLLEALARSWQGLATINVAVSDHTALSPTLVRTVVDVATEGINNAIRHGDAENVTVTVQVNDSFVTVDVSDDGQYPEHTARGWGSDLLDYAAPGRWTRTHGTNGTVLHVQMTRV